MKKVSVADFGAYPNTGEFVSESIQKAIDYCFQNGGGEVIIPTGTYRIKGLRLRSNVTLRLLEYAMLIGSRNKDDYFILDNDEIEPVDSALLDSTDWERLTGEAKLKKFHKYGSRWHNAMIRAFNAENIAIIGERGSIIDGDNCFDAGGEEKYRGPHGIGIINCENVVLKGYTMRNTGNWAQEIQNTNNILIENILCLAGHDGVHMTTCEDVIIKGCEFCTGDDCVAGFDNKNVIVEDCKLNTACNVFRMGGTNIFIHHCEVYTPPVYLFRGSMSMEEKQESIMSNDAEFAKDFSRANTLSLFTYYADASVNIKNPATNIIIRDCKVSGTQRFLHFNYSGNEPWQNNRPLLDIKFENIVAEDIEMPLTAYGDKENPVEITLNNIDFSFKKGYEKNPFMHVANFKKIKLKNINVKNACGECFIKSWSSDGDFEFVNLNCDIPEENLVKYTTEEFVCKCI